MAYVLLLELCWVLGYEKVSYLVAVAVHNGSTVAVSVALPELGPSIGLGGLPVSCSVKKALGATEGCVDVMFVAIPLLHRRPTGLICVF